MTLMINAFWEKIENGSKVQPSDMLSSSSYFPCFVSISVKICFQNISDMITLVMDFRWKVSLFSFVMNKITATLIR